MTNLMLRGDDGHFYYMAPHLDATHRLAWFADDVQMSTRPRGQHYQSQGWLVSDHQATEIVARWEGYRPTSGWRLADPAFATEKLPLEVSHNDFHAMPDNVRESGLYKAIEGEPERHERRFAAADWIAYDGSPCPADGLTWVAELPYEIAHHRELHHLFPGYLNGFREAAEAQVKDRPHVQFVFDRNRTGHYEITLQIPYDVPKSRWQPRILRNGGESRRDGRNVPVTYRAEVKVQLPRAIAGPNRAAAVVEWNRRLAALDDLIAEASEVRACSHCDGQGVLAGKPVDR